MALFEHSYPYCRQFDVSYQSKQRMRWILLLLGVHLSLVFAKVVN